MAIIIPESCRGLSAGAMRQLKHDGYTSASGGLFATDFVRGQVGTRTSDYLRHNEPLGIYMSALEQTKNDAAELSEAIQKNTRAMVDAAESATKRLNDSTGKLRDGAEKLGLAMEKFSKIANNTNFAKTAETAASLVESLERLAKLQESGMLDKVMQAMGKP